MTEPANPTTSLQVVTPSKPPKKRASTAVAEFRKTNEAISLHVSEGRLTLMARKIFNVMVHTAQKAGAPGRNAPLDTEAAKKYFWLPMADLARDTAYNSNDTKLLQKMAEDLCRVRIQITDDRQWTAEQLVAGIKIYNPAGLNKRGGQVWFGFAFPPEVQAHVMQPNTYTTFSLYYQTLFRSPTAMALYEECRKYATNPSHLTARKPWRWWYHTLTGNPVSEEPPEFKFFKRDRLKTAIAEVNAVTDVTVTLIEHCAGRRVVDLQFEVHLKSQAELEFPGPPIINSALIQRLVSLGLTPRDAADVSCSYEETYLNMTLDLVDKRRTNTDLPPLESVPAFLRAALKRQYVQPVDVARQSLPPPPPVAKRPGEDPLTQAFLAERRRRILEYYAEIDEPDRQKYLADFTAAAPAFLQHPLRTKGLAAKPVQHAFATWLADQVWGSPTDQQLLDFARAKSIADAAGGRVIDQSP